MPGFKKTGSELAANYFHASQNNPTSAANQNAVLQTQQADFINIEITFRDKQNQKKRIIFTNNPSKATTSAAGSQTARANTERSAGAIERIIPINGVIQRGKWTNLCIDLGSLSAHLFSHASAKEK